MLDVITQQGESFPLQEPEAAPLPALQQRAGLGKESCWKAGQELRWGSPQQGTGMN